MRLTLLVTTPRVAPGLMTWSAWRAIADADRVLCSGVSLPVAKAVAAAGFEVASHEGDLLELTGSVAWLASDEEATRLPRELAESIVSGNAAEIEVLHASYDVPGARLLDLVTVMDRLRNECPWDQKQTHRSLARYLLEESYETLEAIESGDYDHLREELGDLLLQVYFHSRIAEESGDAGFTIDDVAGGIVEKLVYRHPHVFAGLEVEDAGEVDRNWEALKAAEKKRASPLDGIPIDLPALALADKVLGRLGSTEVAAVRGEVAKSAEAVEPADLGERLLALVAEARRHDVDPEQALREAVRRLTDAS